MKGLSLRNTTAIIFNGLVALLLFAACAVPYISNERFSFLSFLGLAVPLLVAVNLLFLLYWSVLRRKQLWLSVLALLCGYFFLGTFITFDFDSDTAHKDDLRVLSYNVRGFNKWKELDNPQVFEDVKKFVDQEQPDVICFQEPGYRRAKEYLKNYPYQYLDYIYMNGKVLLGIFSKYPIVDRDLLCFPDSPNNGAYADILYKKDTIRVYNIHLQSLGVTPGKGILTNEPKDKLFKKLTRNFKFQQQQAKMIRDHMQSNPYPQIVCGDFNNTQFSNAYRIIRGEKSDTFLEKGSGYGRTLNFHGFPLRIDFIFSDAVFKIKDHTTYDVEYSDHYPIMASFELKSDQ